MLYMLEALMLNILRRPCAESHVVVNLSSQCKPAVKEQIVIASMLHDLLYKRFRDAIAPPGN